jgi:hypothetical protein
MYRSPLDFFHHAALAEGASCGYRLVAQSRTGLGASARRTKAISVVSRRNASITRRLHFCNLAEVFIAGTSPPDRWLLRKHDFNSARR